MIKTGKSAIFVAALVAIWLMTVSLGMAWVWSYKAAAGAPAKTESRWPASSRISRISGRATLLLIVHPQCPCSRATLSELARLLADSGRNFETIVAFVRPPGTPADWEQGWLWTRAAEIPGVRPIVDLDGREASLFGAKTSGQVFYYDPSGLLRFSGGITPARGHEGASAGYRQISLLARGGAGDRSVTSVFGCSLLDSP